MVHLVLTHGRSQEFGIPATMLDEWEAALRYGLERAKAPFAKDIPVSLAFYGDYWRPDAEEAAERAVDDTPSELQTALAMEMAAAAPQARERALETERLGWDSLNGLVVWLDDHIKVGDLAVGWFMRDVESYFSDGELREKAIARIVDAVNAAADEVVLLGHSLGTVVAYDALRRHPDLPVRGYVSLGSPLGLPTVRRSLQETDGALRFPDDLERWVNIYDKRDFVTGNQPLAALYPAADGRGVEDSLSQGKRPSVLKPNAAHDGVVYLSAVVLGKAVRSLVETIEGGRESAGERGFAMAEPPDHAFETMVAANGGGAASPNGDGERSWEPEAGALPDFAFAIDEGGGETAEAAPPGAGERSGEVAVKPVAKAKKRQRKPAKARMRKVERAASAEFPYVVPPGSINTLRYQIGVKARHAADTTIVTEVPADAERLELTVVVQAADFAVLDPKTNEPSAAAATAPLSLDLMNEEAEAEGEFLLRAKASDEPLSSTIHLRFLHGNTPVGHIPLPTIIAGDAAGIVRPAEEPRGAAIRVSADAAPDPDLVIFVNLAAQGTFEIAVSRLGRGKRKTYKRELGFVSVVGEPWQWAKAMLEKFRLARDLKPAERKERIENLGRELWRQLPRDFQEFYWEEMHGKDLTIAISSEEPYIPWELIKPEREGGGRAAPILGTAFSIARWKEDRYLPDPIVVSEFRVVAPTYPANALPAADLEANDLVARFKAERVNPGRRAQVIKLLKSKNLQVLHFSGHGRFGDTPNDTRIALLDRPLDLIDLNSAGFAAAEDPPLVFLNACEVGEQGWSLTQIGGWAEAFCQAGSTGFVGPYWAVNDQVARKAALLFYDSLRAGQTVGEAIREVRRQFTADKEFRHHPTWLAYTLHCQPNVTVAFPEAG